MHTVIKHLTLMIGGIAFLAGCGDEPRPRSAQEFLDSPFMLEAAMVRCSQDRAATRYDAECVNARQAVSQIEAKEEAARHAEFEARSNSKRRALRRTQEAVAEARRRATQADRLREEAEYLAQFGVAPPPPGGQLVDAAENLGDLPVAVLPESDQSKNLSSGPGDVLPATDGGNAPVMVTEPDVEEPATDLESIREELQRRNEEGAD
jgi:hypothetical protein